MADVSIANQRRVSAGRTAGIALFLLTALNLFNFIDRYILPGVQPLVQTEFGVKISRISWTRRGGVSRLFSSHPLPGAVFYNKDHGNRFEHESLPLYR